MGLRRATELDPDLLSVDEIVRSKPLHDALACPLRSCRRHVCVRPRHLPRYSDRRRDAGGSLLGPMRHLDVPLLEANCAGDSS